tara:strand:+ start:124 stop:2529 length:2406 start_codon:yes stop_codon:yes gene_type:complete
MPRLLHLLGAAIAHGHGMQYTQTARQGDGTLILLQDMPPLRVERMADAPTGPTITLDSSKMHQEFVGFGGAFTEASALNWKKLTEADQAEVIRLYFSDATAGGLGYTMGRVPINSCDFSPASYNFDDTPDDAELKHFDSTVAHDVEAGMIPMIKAAMEAVEARGLELKLLASPWSPPAWMKLPLNGVRSMVLSAKPNGLDPKMQRPWAEYFSKWLSAYKAHGIDFWGVTVQNEPEATAGWESMLYTPAFMASFVRDHLGPVLKAEQPGVKIIGFDHNKDHVLEWAQGLYADPAAAQYFDGVGVHWYGGLNTDNLQATHELAPDKLILATEACNCVGNVVLSEPNLAAWWTRAERLALDILEDLRYWTSSWLDWNLLVDTTGGPNHLKNLCDANIIADANNSLGKGTLIKQASYYYMGHFSRYLVPGAKRLELTQNVETSPPPLSPADVKNGVALAFVKCDSDSAVQRWAMGKHGGVVASGTNEAPGSDGYAIGGECMEHCISGECWFPKVQVWACGKPGDGNALHGGPGNQKWEVHDVLIPPGGSQLKNPATNQCLTAVTTAGWAVGLDAGVTAVAAQLFDCYPAGTRNQTFLLVGDGKGETIKDGTFSIGGTGAEAGLCLQPQLEQLPKFDAVAFSQPDGTVSLVAMNTNDYDVPLTIYDEATATGVAHSVPPHAIHTYRWHPKEAAAEAAAVAAATAEAPLAAAAQSLMAAVVGQPAAADAQRASSNDRAAEVPAPSTTLAPMLLLVVAVAAVAASSRLASRIDAARDTGEAHWPVAQQDADDHDGDESRAYKEFGSRM